MTSVLRKHFHLISLALISSFLRFSGLGYSNFYGDETKTLYLNKTIPAFSFFMNQRKGPIQFLVVWLMEKLTGGYPEFFIRLPFALASILSIIVFYLLLRKLFNAKVAFISSLIFSINGFSIAFGRTAQYQSFLLLFGLLSLYFLLLFIDNTLKKYLLILSFFFLALAVLSHYDGLFYLIPFTVIIISNYSNLKKSKGIIRWTLFSFTLSLTVISIFYLPYYLNGNFNTNASGYLSRRVLGSGYSPNNSLYTAKIYNPFFIPFIFISLSLFGIVGQFNWKKIMLILWFVVPFIVFEFVFLNPGTHIFNYYLPLFILSGVGIIWLYDSFKEVYAQKLFLILIVFLFILNTLIMVFIYIPMFNFGYPWKVFSPNKTYHLYLYGFPYNRSWDEVGSYLKSKEARNFYTNDNITVAEYYLYGIPSTQLVISEKQYPQYYIYVYDNQEFNSENEKETLPNFYVLDKEFYSNGRVVARLFRN